MQLPGRRGGSQATGLAQHTGPRASLRSRDRRDGLPVGLQLEAVAEDESNDDIAIQAEDGDVFPIPGIDRDREGDLGAVRGPGRGPLRGRAIGQLHQARAVAPDRPQVPVPFTTVALEDQPSTVGRPGGFRSLAGLTVSLR